MEMVGLRSLRKIDTHRFTLAIFKSIGNNAKSQNLSLPQDIGSITRYLARVPWPLFGYRIDNL